MSITVDNVVFADSRLTIDVHVRLNCRFYDAFVFDATLPVTPSDIVSMEALGPMLRAYSQWAAGLLLRSEESWPMMGMPGDVRLTAMVRDSILRVDVVLDDVRWHRWLDMWRHVGVAFWHYGDMWT